MKKIFKTLLIFLLICSIFIIGFFVGNNFNKQKEPVKIQKTETAKKEVVYTNLVSSNGYLNIKDNTLVNEKNDKIQLRGMSSHGIQWFSELITEDNLKYLRDNYNSNLFRVAMYTNENGYIKNKNLKEKVIEYVDLAIKLDMYVIIDWHILSDNDPLIYKEEAKLFFNEMSSKYKDYPNVIYEICNEPNGNVTWDNNVRPYAEEVINVIRNNTKKAIIIVGTPTWSQDVDKAANNPINDEKVMYALHFYSGTHTQWLRDRAKQALNTIPIFVSEWGVSDASGNGGVYLDEAQKWVEFMKENNLTWANWSLADKDESSAFLKPNLKIINEDNLSESGKFVSNAIKN